MRGWDSDQYNKSKEVGRAIINSSRIFKATEERDRGIVLILSDSVVT